MKFDEPTREVHYPPVNSTVGGLTREQRDERRRMSRRKGKPTKRKAAR